VPGDPLPRTAGRVGGRGPWARRFWRELGSVTAERDPVVRLIVLERLVKSAALLALTTTLLTANRLGYLQQWAGELQEQLNLTAGRGVISVVLTWVAEQLGHLLPHVTIVALALILYAVLETTEGVGLAMGRRWAEYLTVVATGLLIPWEAIEVAARPTPFRVAALLVNAGIVAYLAYRRRLFVDV